MGFGGASRYREMNVYKPLMIFNSTHFINDHDRWLRQLLASDHDLTLKAAALQFSFVTEELFDRGVDPAKMITLYVTTDKEWKIVLVPPYSRPGLNDRRKE